MTEAWKPGVATSLGAGDGAAAACRALAAVAVTEGCRWVPGPDAAWLGVQAATHTMVSAAAVTNGARLLTVPGS